MIKMICKDCGREIPEGKLYCDYCEYVVVSGDRLFKQPDPNCENGDTGETKNNLWVFFEKTDQFFQTDYFKKVFREKAGGNDEFFGNMQYLIYELLYHHFCEMVILNNTYSDNEIELFEELVILYTKFKQKDSIKPLKEVNIPIINFRMSRNELDLKLVCKGIEKNPQYHMNYIDRTGEINLILSHMLNLFAVTAVYDKTGDFVDLAYLYSDILKGFIRACPNASEKAITFIGEIVNAVNIRFNGHYSFILENDLDEFTPTKEQEHVKALMDFTITALEQYPTEIAALATKQAIVDLAAKLKIGYLIFGCFLIEKMTELSTERYQIIKYYFRDYFIDCVQLKDFHAVYLLQYFGDNSKNFEGFYDDWPKYFNAFKKLDQTTVEAAGAPFSKIVLLAFSNIHHHIVGAERMLSEKKVNDSIRFLKKANEITGTT